MTDPAPLRPLLRLYDDDSPTVRAAVLDALAAWGDGLGDALRDLVDPPREEVVAAVLDAVAAHLAGPPPAVKAERVVFRVGQLVTHRRYGYRGVVVSRDATCRASDAWYARNRTQPDRDQPWYHVLVHETDSVTYAAHSSLTTDESAEDIEHPLLEHFFEGKQSGRYVRNERPWPEIDA